MLKVDVNVSILLKEVPFLDRFARAAELGFGAVEFWWPGEDALEAVAERLRDNDLRAALMNFDAGDIPGGDRGFLNDPAREGRFREHVPVAVAFARGAGIPWLNALVGNAVEGADREDQLALVRDNLAYACDEAARAGVGVVVEPLNLWESPRYLLGTTRETLALLDQVGRPNLKLQYDVYHMQRMEGDLVATLRRAIERIGHVQLADAPDRREPGTGEINYPYVLAALEALDYQGYVGLEYNAAGGSEASFAWLPADRRRPLTVRDLRLGAAVGAA
jgi:hydroxypyruvate isomerase